KLNVPWWARRHQAILDHNRRGDVDVILIGDSMLHRLDFQPQVWNRYFVPLHAVNMGYGGDATQHFLWRLEHGELEGISPKGALIEIGTNNTATETSEEIADGVVAICRVLRSRLPETKIILLAIFPCGLEWAAKKTSGASRLFSRVADGKNIFYLNLNDGFLKS